MHHLTPDEIKELIKHISVDRNKLLVRIGFLHGLRVSELINLTRESIAGGYINVQRLKGSLHTIQPWVRHPDPELSEYEGLTEMQRKLKPREKLFPVTRNAVFKMIQKAGAKAGIPKHKLHPHALKHSCAMHLIGGAGIHNVRQYLGHRSISSTGEYLKVSDETASKAATKAFGE